jgi:methylthioribose-1-phosphate isomerase
MGMALAAHECRDRSAEGQLAWLESAAENISHARPTTVSRMKIITDGCLAAARRAIEAGEDATEAIMAHTIEANNLRYSKVRRTAAYLVDMIPDGGTVMTQCFGETIVGMMLKECRDRNKAIRLFCPETRPYFQGARLTATVCRDMGFDVTVITDNMPATVMQNEGVDVFTSAADAISLDGYVVNKVGTFQIAIVARYMGVPYFVTGAPDPGHPTVDTVTIEMRDPEFVLQAMGTRTAARGVKGYYPSFDVTPPHLVSGVVTDSGIYSPYDLPRYFKNSDGEFGQGGLNL